VGTPPVIAARQTVHSGTASQACRCRAVPLPAPRVRFLVLVCVCWRSCDSGERRRGEGCAVLDLGVRACNWLTPVGPPPPFCIALLTAHSAPPALRATGININNGVRGRGRGQGEAVCVRAYMQAHTHFQCPATGPT